MKHKFLILALVIFSVSGNLYAQDCNTILSDSTVLEETKKYKYNFKNKPKVHIGLISAILDGVHICVIEALILEHNLMKYIDINADNDHGVFPLSAAAFRGDVEIAKLLLSIPETDINNGDSVLKITALMDASREGKLGVVRELLKSPNIKVNAKSDLHTTALMHATNEGYVEIVQELLNVDGINVEIKNREGSTALDIVNQELEYFREFHPATRDERFRGLLANYKKIAELLMTTSNTK